MDLVGGTCHRRVYYKHVFGIISINTLRHLLGWRRWNSYGHAQSGKMLFLSISINKSKLYTQCLVISGWMNELHDSEQNEYRGHVCLRFIGFLICNINWQQCINVNTRNQDPQCTSFKSIEQSDKYLEKKKRLQLAQN